MKERFFIPGDSVFNCGAGGNLIFLVTHPQKGNPEVLTPYH